MPVIFFYRTQESTEYTVLHTSVYMGKNQKLINFTSSRIKKKLFRKMDFILRLTPCFWSPFQIDSPDLKCLAVLSDLWNIHESEDMNYDMRL